jgi:hypothetical protein
LTEDDGSLPIRLLMKLLRVLLNLFSLHQREEDFGSAAVDDSTVADVAFTLVENFVAMVDVEKEEVEVRVGEEEVVVILVVTDRSPWRVVDDDEFPPAAAVEGKSVWRKSPKKLILCISSSDLNI